MDIRLALPDSDAPAGPRPRLRTHSGQGIGLNLADPYVCPDDQSPAPSFPPSAASPSSSASNPHTFRSVSVSGIPDARLVTSLLLDEQIRILALREMEIVETSDRIVDLQARLDNLKAEAKQMRTLIRNTINTHIGSSQSPSTSLQPLWDNLSRPLSMLLLLDAMRQPPHLTRRNSTPVKSGPHTNEHIADHWNRDLLLQTVSSSIASFVNDVKTNVMSSLGDDENPGSVPRPLSSKHAKRPMRRRTHEKPLRLASIDWGSGTAELASSLQNAQLAEDMATKRDLDVLSSKYPSLSIPKSQRNQGDSKKEPPHKHEQKHSTDTPPLAQGAPFEDSTDDEKLTDLPFDDDDDEITIDFGMYSDRHL